jgi:hypothetical protein
VRAEPVGVALGSTAGDVITPAAAHEAINTIAQRQR